MGSREIDSRRLRLVAELIAVRIGDKLFESAKRLVEERRGDLVWSFDVFSEKTALELIKLLVPKSIVISEERGIVRLSDDPEYVVLLDPVDGSNNFAHDIPWFCTCVAIAPIDARSLDDIVASAVYAPTITKIFSYSREEGALVNGKSIERSRPKKIISAYFDTSAQFQVLERYCRLRGGGLRVRSLGSIALELCYVAWGRLEGVIDLRKRLRNTDIAAPYPILLASGATVVTDSPIPATSFVQGFELAAFYSSELADVYRRARSAEA
ncbi:MAG: hypothetical protein GXO32_07395 [Crenarchaeota archaeon]|nr:hypothetical protein [Thermoproteota archaeon]